VVHVPAGDHEERGSFDRETFEENNCGKRSNASCLLPAFIVAPRKKEKVVLAFFNGTLKVVLALVSAATFPSVSNCDSSLP